MASGTLVDRYTGVDRYAVCDSTCCMYSTVHVQYVVYFVPLCVLYIMHLVQPLPAPTPADPARLRKSDRHLIFSISIELSNIKTNHQPPSRTSQNHWLPYPVTHIHHVSANHPNPSRRRLPST